MVRLSRLQWRNSPGQVSRDPGFSPTEDQLWLGCDPGTGSLALALCAPILRSPTGCWEASAKLSHMQEPSESWGPGAVLGTSSRDMNRTQSLACPEGKTPALGICSVLNVDLGGLWGLLGRDGSRALRGRERTKCVPGRQPASARQGHELPYHKLSYCSGHEGLSLRKRSDQETRPSRGLQGAANTGSGITLYEICSLEP